MTGQQFALLLDASAKARAGAKATIASPTPGVWVARIGGGVRGELRRFDSRHAAEKAIDDHYNAALMRSIERDRERRFVHA